MKSGIFGRGSSWRAPARLVVGGLVALGASTAHAYEERLHEELTRLAVPEPGPTLEPPDEAELAAWRERLWDQLAAVPDPALQARFRAIAPTAAAFTPAVLKRLLMLDEKTAVAGLDRTLPGTTTRRALLVLASRLPDDDGRNRNRHWLDESGTPRRGATGEPLPIDPAVLEMGKSSGVSSQAHAHYQLLPESMRTDDTDVLQSDPRRFSLPRDAHTFGADFAAIYADLATLAAASGLPRAPWIATVLEGAGLHHVQDVCNQIHTVQVGLYDFFVDAQLSVWKEELRTLGGLLGPRVTLKQAGLRILANHHLFLEDLFARWALDGALPAARLDALKSSLGKADPALVAKLAAATGASFERAAMEVVVEESSREAARVYGLARALAAADLSSWRGRDYAADGPARPLEHLRQDAARTAEQPEWAEFVTLQTAGARRFAAFMAARAETPRGGPDEAAGRLLKLLLTRHDEASRRRAEFADAPPATLGLNKALLVGFAGLVVLAALALRSLVRRRRILP